MINLISSVVIQHHLELSQFTSKFNFSNEQSFKSICYQIEKLKKKNLRLSKLHVTKNNTDP